MNEKLYNKATKADFSKILINKGYAYFTKGSIILILLASEMLVIALIISLMMLLS